MNNTYVNHGFLNFGENGFTTELDESRFETQVSCAFVEYSTGTVRKRIIHRGLVSDHMAGRMRMLVVEQTLEDGADGWSDFKPLKDIATGRRKFCDAVTGQEVPASEATEDDLDNEILDDEGESKNPKEYHKKLVDGYNNEFDKFIKDYFKGVEDPASYVFAVLANQVGVEIP